MAEPHRIGSFPAMALKEQRVTPGVAILTDFNPVFLHLKYTP